MSNHDNHRRGESRRTEHGPRWEDKDPGTGRNTTHIARSRAKWKRREARSVRRTGHSSPKFRRMGAGKPVSEEIE